MEMKNYNLTCGEVIDNLLTLADAYEKASAGKAPNGFAFNPTDAAANMKAALHFIVSFGQQLPVWIPVEERLPEGADGEYVLVTNGSVVGLATHQNGWHHAVGRDAWEPTHWMPLPGGPTAESMTQSQ